GSGVKLESDGVVVVSTGVPGVELVSVLAVESAGREACGVGPNPSPLPLQADAITMARPPRRARSRTPRRNVVLDPIISLASPLMGASTQLHRDMSALRSGG